ncbi:MAG: bifunctional nuclease family protein [Phycisphaerales bacterium]
MSVKMELSRIYIREMIDTQIIELTECDGTRFFPIAIGLPEAFAIERRLKGQTIPRPQTHDLCADIIRQLGGTLTEIHINDLADGTFFARLVIRTESGTIEIDSRPSDAIALGVTGDVPIFVAEKVLEAAGRAAEVADESADESADDADDDPADPSSASPLDWD